MDQDAGWCKTHLSTWVQSIHTDPKCNPQFRVVAATCVGGTRPVCQTLNVLYLSILDSDTSRMADVTSWGARSKGQQRKA